VRKKHQKVDEEGLRTGSGTGRGIRRSQTRRLKGTRVTEKGGRSLFFTAKGSSDGTSGVCDKRGGTVNGRPVITVVAIMAGRRVVSVTRRGRGSNDQYETRVQEERHIPRRGVGGKRKVVAGEDSVSTKRTRPKLPKTTALPK